MTAQEILSRIDHTLLQPTASWQQVQQLCEEAIQYKTASVCMPPCYIRRIRDHFGGELNICTVIGFPLGYQTTRVKLLEARQAIENGACEIDMVINLADAKNGDINWVQAEISAVKKVILDHPLKVIIETCYLTESEKIQLCRVVTEAQADYIKTSTGFGSGGATLADIELIGRHIGSGVKIKASGGIKTREELEQYILAGCDRIGSSSAVDLLKDSL